MSRENANTPDRSDFLPLTDADMRKRGWDRPDFVYVTGDAYVDHPSFGVAIISRILESAGYRVAILAQPDYKTPDDFKRFGKPRLGFLVTAGNIDSMVAHYTVARKRRTYDYYSPGGKAGLRPDRATIVYTNRIREAYGDIPVILGGLEASLRRFAHYDYWDDRMRRSLLVDSRADLLTYGMGEHILLRIAELLDRGIPVRKIRDVRGTVYLCRAGEAVHFPVAEPIYDYDTLKTDPHAYAEAFGIQYRNTDAVNGRAIIESYGDRWLVQNPPMPPLEREELDRVYALPYTRTFHPDYREQGGVPAIEEVRFSITHNRGCFGGCNFCALAFHQGRSVRSRSRESVLAEAKKITQMPDFKGYIHDVGGPTANFRYPSCDRQLEHGVCPNRKCLAPKPCPHLKADHSEYAALLRDIAALPGVKRVFVRSGIRFDYLMADPDRTFFRQLVRDHVSGQLKVAPEHCSDHTLAMMGKPPIRVYEAFREEFFRLSADCGKEQYLVPYLMSSHPGTRLEDAVELALYLKKWNYQPEQVQDFYPTPGTISTVMYATGLDPLTGKEVYVCRDYHEKQLQRALLQFGNPKNADLVREALHRVGRNDLIGTDASCLVRPAHPHAPGQQRGSGNTRAGSGKTGSRGSAGAHTGARSGQPSASAPRGRRSPDTRNPRTDDAGRSTKSTARPTGQRNTRTSRTAPHKKLRNDKGTPNAHTPRRPGKKQG